MPKSEQKNTKEKKFSLNLFVLKAGIMFGLALVSMKFLEYYYFSYKIPLDAYIGIIALAFLGAGVYLGIKFGRKKREVSPNTGEHINGEAVNGVRVDHKLAAEIDLSKREVEVLQNIARGYSNREIADKLFVSQNTVKTHINNIYSKLEVRRRTQAVSKARNMKIIA